MPDAPPPHPGPLLKKAIGNLGRTQEELADALDVSQAYLSLIFAGRRSISLKMALRLEDVFGLPADVWAERQLRFDIHDARRRQRRLRNSARPLTRS